MRIVSLLPGATRMAVELGLGDSLVGVSHACRVPPEAGSPQTVVKPALELNSSSSREIDTAVSRRKNRGDPLHHVVGERVRELEPDLLLTQDLCEVCAPSGEPIDRLVQSLDPSPKTLSISPTDLGGIFRDTLELGRAAGVEQRAREWLNRARRRLSDLEESLRGTSTRPRVFCVEWLDPPYYAGHWVPEQVERAGGLDGLGEPGGKSGRLRWERVRRYDPSYLLLMPCGYSTGRVVEEADRLLDYEGYPDLKAVRRGHVFALDAGTYFARPGPDVIEGVRLLAHLLHPDRVDWMGPTDAFERLDLV